MCTIRLYELALKLLAAALERKEEGKEALIDFLVMFRRSICSFSPKRYSQKQPTVFIVCFPTVKEFYSHYKHQFEFHVTNL